MRWQDKLRAGAGAARRWSSDRLDQARALLEDRIAKISEVPGLPEPLLQVLRETRGSLLRLITKVRKKEDLKQLRGAMVDVVAGAVDALAVGSTKEPGSFKSINDVRHFCQETIKWGAGAVDGVALIAGTFAVSAAAHTFGISFGHFFALCAVMGILYSLAVGASEIYAVASLLVSEGHPEPAREALRLCSKTRRYKRGTDDNQDDDEKAPEPTVQNGTSSDEARRLAATWVKLSLAAAMPVFNDRHMQDRLDALMEILHRRIQETSAGS